MNEVVSDAVGAVSRLRHSVRVGANIVVAGWFTVVGLALAGAVPAGTSVSAVRLQFAGSAIGGGLAAVLAPVFALGIAIGTGRKGSCGVFVFTAVTETGDLLFWIIGIVGREIRI